MSNPQMPLLAIQSSYYGQRASPSSSSCAISLSSQWLEPPMGSDCTKFPWGAAELLCAFQPHTIPGWTVWEFPLATHSTKAACGQSKTPDGQPGTGEPFPEAAGKPSSTVNVPHRWTRRHQPGTKSLGWAQNPQLNLASVENPKKILGKH